MKGEELLNRIRHGTEYDNWHELQKELLEYIKDPKSPADMVKKLSGYTELVAMICDGLN